MVSPIIALRSLAQFATAHGAVELKAAILASAKQDGDQATFVTCLETVQTVLDEVARVLSSTADKMS